MKFCLPHSVVSMLLVLLPTVGVCQKQGAFQHFTTNDGLSRSYVKSIVQDAQGFLWLGTSDGLSRYDGYDFTVYRCEVGDEYALSNDEINVLGEDRQRRLWVGTNGGGLNQYLPHRNGFVAHTTQNSALRSDRITALYEDRRGKLWVGTAEGLHYLDPTTDSLRRWKPTSDEPDFRQKINAIAEDQRGRLWVGTPQGPGLIAEGRMVFPVADSLSAYAVSSIIEDEAGYLWLGTKFQGILVVAPASDRSQLTVAKHLTHDPQDNHSLSSNLILTMFRDRSNTIWVGTDLGGLNKYDTEQQQFTHYQNDNRIESSISSNNILSIEEDRRGNLWVGTNFGGLNFLETNPRFEHFKSNPYHYVSSPVLSVHVDKARHLWMGTDGDGLSRLSPDGSFVQYTNQGPGKNAIGGNTVQEIYEDPAGNLWLGTYHHGLSVLQSDGTVKNYQQSNGQGLSSNDIRAILADSRGNRWVGTNGGGLNRYDPQQDRFTAFREEANDPHSLPSDSVVCLYEDSRGLVWVGTVHGSVCFFDPTGFSGETIKFYRIKLPVDDSEKRYGNSVISITEDAEGQMWFGNYVSGLTRLEFDTRHLRQYDESDGLPGNTVNGLLTDRAGAVWISTNQGLARYDAPQDTFRVYNKLDGLPGQEFLHGSYFRDADGKLYFGGVNGVSAFYPDRIKRSVHVPTVAITNVRVFNEEVARQRPETAAADPLSDAGEVVLNHNRSTFTVDFVALSYPHAEKNQYAVMLEGLEEQWRPIGTDRTATYTNVPPGEYTFRVKGSNRDGVWNEAGATLAVHVLAPWWKTPGAYFGYVLLLGGILYGAIKLTVKRVRLNERLKLVEEEKAFEHRDHQSKIDFFTNISHEFRTPLTLIMSPLEKILTSGSDIFRPQHQRMYRNAQSLLHLVDQVLDFRKVTEGSLSLHGAEINLGAFVAREYEQFEELSHERNIDFRIEASERISIWADVEKLEKVMHNLLSNAFKFTPDHGTITIRVALKDQAEAQAIARAHALPDALLSGFAEITVSDSGRGIPKEALNKIFDRFYQVEDHAPRAAPGTGIGLALAKELVALHHGTISAQSGPTGSTFSVRLPQDGHGFTPEEQTGATEAPARPKARERTKENASFVDVLPDVQKGALTENGADLPQILIVDDNAELRMLLRENLQAAFRVSEAANGREALARAEATPPELVVTDVMMPVMDGYELCQRLKENIHTSHIPVIILTARTAVAQQIQGIATGADAYLTKPFSLAFLETRIGKLIESRRKLRARYSKSEILAPDQISITSVDEEFLQRVKQILEEHVDDPSFSVDCFCRQIGMSNTQLYLKVKALTGFSVNELVRDFRLKRAAQLLRDSEQTVGEIAQAVGFNDAKYFSRCLRKQFGKTPSDYRRHHREKV